MMINSARYTIFSQIWDCGDDYCACSQCQIVLRRDGIMPIIEKNIWEGEFYTNGEFDFEKELPILKNKALEYGINNIEKDGFGSRELTETEFNILYDTK